MNLYIVSNFVLNLIHVYNVSCSISSAMSCLILCSISCLDSCSNSCSNCCLISCAISCLKLCSISCSNRVQFQFSKVHLSMVLNKLLLLYFCIERDCINTVCLLLKALAYKDYLRARTQTTLLNVEHLYLF